MQTRLFLTLLFLGSACMSAAQKKNRQPGKLLLNMLIKNEAEHLERSLPKWAPLIDYWIVGIGLHPIQQCPRTQKFRIF
jgi:hypothetical protein